MSLAKAMRTFIQANGDRSAMSVPAWATTYGVGVEDVRAEFERQITEHSRQPQNTYDSEGK